jgi:hydroxyacylglutathione hydrolase
VDPSGRDAVLVDPSWEMETIERALRVSGARLRGVLVTHAHFDHVHLAEAVATRHGCPIWMSNTEIASSGFHARGLVGLDEEPWSIGGLHIEPIETPGHTPGSVCYLIGDSAFTGDVLFAETCGLCSDAKAAYAMFASLERLKERLGPRTRVYPGHSYGVPPGQTMTQVLKDNIYLHFRDPESFAAYRLRRGLDRTSAFRFAASK